MSDLNNLSVTELQAMIDQAETALKEKQKSHRKEVYAQIRELAASVGAVVEITEANNKKSVRKITKVAPKYRHPNDAEKTWTGRGVAPVWMRELIASGHDKSEFLI